MHNLWLWKTKRVIAEWYIPPESTGEWPAFVSHETACIINTNEQDAHVQCRIYFSDQDPVGPYQIMVWAHRTSHVRFNDLQDPAPVPVGTDYASVFVSDLPIVIQHTRLDSRQAENALLSTIAYSQ